MSILKYAAVFAAVATLAIAYDPSHSVAQTKAKATTAAKAKMTPVPPGGCAISEGALENGKTCAGSCNDWQWCGIQWCTDGKLVQVIGACYDPTGLCTPKC